MTRAFGFIAELVLWGVIAFIAATVLARGQNTPGHSPAVEPQKARIQSHSGPRPCLSREDIDGSYPRYRVVGGRRCWYASKRGDGGSKALPDRQTQARNCEEQALKLFDPEEIKQGGANEKSMFVKQCMSN